MNNVLKVLLFLALAVSVCKADDATYAVNLIFGSGSMVGTITTDGTDGVLNTSDIVSWNLTVTGLEPTVICPPRQPACYSTMPWATVARGASLVPRDNSVSQVPLTASGLLIPLGHGISITTTSGHTLMHRVNRYSAVKFQNRARWACWARD